MPSAGSLVQHGCKQIVHSFSLHSPAAVSSLVTSTLSGSSWATSTGVRESLHRLAERKTQQDTYVIILQSALDMDQILIKINKVFSVT